MNPASKYRPLIECDNSFCIFLSFLF